METTTYRTVQTGPNKYTGGAKKGLMNCPYQAALEALPMPDTPEVISTPLSPSKAQLSVLPQLCLGLSALQADSAVRRWHGIGDPFVDHLISTRDWEWQQWLDGVNDWEFKRYFEII